MKKKITLKILNIENFNKKKSLKFKMKNPTF